MDKPKRTSQQDRAIQRIEEYQLKNRRYEEKLKAGFMAFMDNLPPEGCDSLARDILRAKTDDDLYAVFRNLIASLIHPMKTVSRSATESPSMSSNSQENVGIVALDDPQSHIKYFRDQCLKRDKGRCVVTGSMDSNEWKAQGRPNDIDFADLEATHIVPFAFANWTASSEPPDRIWETLYRLFPNVHQVGLNADNINDPFNMICLEEIIHKAFKQFYIAFQPTENSNVYTIKIYRNCFSVARKLLQDNNKTITFSPSDNGDIPPPHPAFLETHWHLAEILDASKLDEIIDKHVRNWEDLKDCHGGLASNGSTDIGKILHVALGLRVEA